MTDSFTLSLGGLQVRWGTPGEQRAEVSLDGDLDNLSVPVLREALDALYAQGCFEIRLDLTDLAFTDSSGLGAMVGAWRRCQREGGTVSVVNPSPSVRRLMDMTGISKLLLAPA
ncbi:MAG TPA: STAS domain-containing protein [Acidimicrobiales bacterium]|jgi:anti-anti-sigma factor|nr:STAS domain-containing protein [Acidimicrobiales bacterium]